MSRTGRLFQRESKPGGTTPFSRKPVNEPEKTVVSPFSRVLEMQRSAGNKAVARLFDSGAGRAEFAAGPPPDIHERAFAHSVSCRGQHLPPGARNYFEPRFGRDFSGVKVHTCGSAVQMNRELNARAFTYGNNIFFNRGNYSPGTAEGKRLLAHELSHVLQQENGGKRIQRSGPPVVGCFRQNAKACLVHLHGNETVALEVAKDLYCNHCVNLVYIDHSVRNLRVKGKVKDGRQFRNFNCIADPNRIFQDEAVTDDTNWTKWNKKRESCLEDPVKTAAQQAVIDYRKKELEPKIRQCRGGRVLEGGNIEGEGIAGPHPMVAFHNNTATNVGTKGYKRSIGKKTERLSICSYCGGHNEWGATEQSTEKVGNDVVRQPNLCCVTTKSPFSPPFYNPHIVEGQDVDDFILVTQQTDFDTLARQGRNVVLQSQNPTEDGSLSVKAKEGRYINIEAQHPYTLGEKRKSRSEVRTTKEARYIQQKMGIGALENSLGIARGVTNCPPLSGLDNGCPTCDGTALDTSAPNLPTLPSCPVKDDPQCRKAKVKEDEG